CSGRGTSWPGASAGRWRWPAPMCGPGQPSSRSACGAPPSPSRSGGSRRPSQLEAYSP
ncbi:MAG: hypothetical protein AVDCRST_MAG76-3526, partial [uncultured Acidimicrobiales bacterium]